MNDKTANVLYKIGKVPLGLYIAYYVLISLVSPMMFEVEKIDLGVIVHLIKGTAIIFGSPLIIIIPAIYLSKKYPIVIGAALVCISVLLAIYMLTDPINLGSDNEELFFIGPPSITFLLSGALFLSSGLIWRRNKKNETTGQTQGETSA